MVTVGDYVFPEDRFYTRDHLWIKIEGSEATVGIDPLGLAIAGKISIIRVKKVGKELKKGKAFGTMESGKGVVPLKSPFDGTISAIGPALEEKRFDDIMESPYDNWLLKITMSNPDDTGDLLKDAGDINNWAKEELKKVK